MALKSQKNGLKKTSNKRIIKKIILLLLSFILLFLFFRYTYTNDVFDKLKNANLGLIAIATFLLLVLPIIKAFRFEMLIRKSITSYNKIQNILVHYIVPIAGFFTPGKLGEGLKILIFKGKRKYAAAFFVIEKSIDVLVLLGLSIIGLIIFKFSYSLIILLILVFIFLIILIIKIRSIGPFLFNLIKKKNIAENLDKSSTSIGAVNWIYTLLFTLVNWIIDFSVVYLVALSVGIKINFFILIYIFSMSMIIGVISGLPGGLGSREISFLIIMQAFLNIDKGLILSFNIVLLFITYFIYIITYIIGFVVYNRLENKF